MATQKTNLYVNQSPQESTYLTVDAGGGVGVSNTQLEVGGRLHVVHGSHTLTSALTANTDYLALCRIPKNAKVLSCVLICAAAGTTTGNLGYYSIGTDGTTLTIISTGNQLQTTADAVTLNAAGRKEMIVAAARIGRTPSEVALCYMPTTTNTTTATVIDYVVTYTFD